jgi:hypothetical protein
MLIVFDVIAWFLLVIDYSICRTVICCLDDNFKWSDSILCKVVA